MIVTKKALVIEKIEKPYDFNGRQGITRAVRVLVETDIFRCKVTEEVLPLLELGKEAVIDMSIRTVKEEPLFEIVSVNKK